MATVTDDEMRALLPTTRTYTTVILRAGPRLDQPGAYAIVGEHGRRNVELRADGVLAVVCPVTDDTEVCGIGIFTTDPAETAAIMDEDPGVLAGVFVYEVHPCRGFPGDGLPA